MASFINTYTQKDKIIHMLVCSVITLYSYCIISQFVPKRTALPSSALISLIIGAIKEIIDGLTGKGTSSAKDFIADCIGTIITVIPLIFI